MFRADAGGKGVLSGLGHGTKNSRELFRAFACAIHHFRLPPPAQPVEIEFGKPEIGFFGFMVCARHKVGDDPSDQTDPTDQSD